MPKNKRVLFVCDDTNLNEVILFCLEGWGYTVEILKSENPKIKQVKQKEPELIIIDLSIQHIKSRLALCRTLKDDFITKAVPLIVLIDKRQLRKHLLTLKHGIDDYLFKPPDPVDLRIRLEMAIRRTQYSFYTNSLTHLGGGRIIEEMLSEKIANDETFSLAHIDIDNFKSFNDKYGYVKGDKVITQTAYILCQTVKQYGSKNDFVGHIGGDDFVFITSPSRQRIIAGKFIAQFNRLIPLHYPQADRKKGVIKVEDRSGIVRKFPLMTVTVAIVNNKDRNFKNIVELNEVISSLKSYLKSQPGSKFMVERRRRNKGIRKRTASTDNKPSYKKVQRHKPVPPLGQLLVNKGLISKDDLEDVLQVHWRRGLPLGEVLRDLKFVTINDIKSLLEYQKSLK